MISFFISTIATGSSQPILCLRAAQSSLVRSAKTVFQLFSPCRNRDKSRGFYRRRGHSPHPFILVIRRLEKTWFYFVWDGKSLKGSLFGEKTCSFVSSIKRFFL